MASLSWMTHVSSLDANSIFQAFSFLRNSIKDAQQVFVLTHNFDFLRLLVNWIKNSKQKAGYYMIKNNLRCLWKPQCID